MTTPCCYPTCATLSVSARFHLQGYLLGGQRTAAPTSILQLSSGYTLDFADYTLLAQVGNQKQLQNHFSYCRTNS